MIACDTLLIKQQH